MKQPQTYLSHGYPRTWWRHQIQQFSPLLALCEGNSLVRILDTCIHLFHVYIYQPLTENCMASKHYGLEYASQYNQAILLVTGKFPAQRTVTRGFAHNTPSICFRDRVVNMRAGIEIHSRYIPWCRLKKVLHSWTLSHSVLCLQTISVMRLKSVGIMLTSSNGNIFALLALCAGNSPITAEFPTKRPMTRSFDIFFDLRVNKQLSKQSWGWWVWNASELIMTSL